MLHDTIMACRTYRRFHEEDRIDADLLRSWVDTARFVASSGNAQTLRYAIVSEAAQCERVFSCLAWARALPNWPGPAAGERPSAYIIICQDGNRMLSDLFTARDEGIAAQTVMLQATESGYGGCIVASVKKRSLSSVLGLEDTAIQPSLVLALGKPAEEVRVAALPDDGSVSYWRDAADVHHVPKRSLDDVLLPEPGAPDRKAF